MKKFLLTFLCALTTLFGVAQNSKVYTEPLVVTINGKSTEPQSADVTVYDNGDGTINFVLKNFILDIDEDKLYVGNINVENLSVTKGDDGLDHISFSGNIFIQEGDIEGVDEWAGPMISSLNKDEEGNPLGIPIVLDGKMNSEKLYVTIDIDMQNILQQVIYVQVGTDDFVVSVKGDANGDGKVDIADVVAILNAMASDLTDSKFDVNDDGKIDIADVVAVLNIMAQQ